MQEQTVGPPLLVWMQLWDQQPACVSDTVLASVLGGRMYRWEGYSETLVQPEELERKSRSSSAEGGVATGDPEVNLNL